MLMIISINFNSIIVRLKLIVRLPRFQFYNSSIKSISIIVRLKFQFYNSTIKTAMTVLSIVNFNSIIVRLKR